MITPFTVTIYLTFYTMKLIQNTLMAATAMPTVSTTSFTILFILDHTANDQAYNHNQYSAYDHCSHGNSSFS